MTSINTVTVLGADGSLGAPILHALVSSGFTVTVLKRESSSSASAYPPDVQVSRVPDAFPVAALLPLLTGQDAVVVSMRVDPAQMELQKRVAIAAAQAGVRRFIPADFGSCDSASPRTQALVPLYRRKTEVREHLQQLARAHPSFSWTSLVCGHFFDADPAFLHLYPAERRADVFDGADTAAAAPRFSVSTLARIAEAVARVLQRPAATADRVLFIQSACVRQADVVAAFERATGGGPWAVRRVDAAAFERAEKAKADAGGDPHAVENLVWLLGTFEADWTRREGFAMELLGLEDEDLDEMARKAVERLG